MPRSALRNRHTTIAEHMPRAIADTPTGRRPASLARPSRSARPPPALCDAIMRAKPHPEQGFRACLGILRLAKSYGGERLEAACRRGLDIGATTYGSIASILKSGLDRAYREEGAAEPLSNPTTPTSAAADTTTDKESTMLNHPTHERLIAFGLHGMAKAFDEQRRQPDIAALGFEERLGLMIDREATERDNKRLVDAPQVRQPAPVCRDRGHRSAHRPRPRPRPVPEARRRRLDRPPP